jgi:uncharacterized protein
MNRKILLFPALAAIAASALLPLVKLTSVAIDGWKFATAGFADQSRGYRRKQQWKSAFAPLAHPFVAAAWFAFLKSKEFRFVAAARPRLYFKPFRIYLALGWPIKQRIKVIRDTYAFIVERGEAWKRVITDPAGVIVARIPLDDAGEGVLRLGWEEGCRKEGEVVLMFESETLGGKIAVAAFSFEKELDGRWLCRVGCVQGQKEAVAGSSKVVQKKMHGLRPKALMVFAVQEFARRLGVPAVCGTGNTIQAHLRKHAIHLPWRHAIRFDYDALWAEAGGRPIDKGWWELPLPPVRKSIDEIESKKRAMYTRRYTMLDDIAGQIGESAVCKR